MKLVKKIFPFIIILILLLVIKNNIGAIFESLDKANPTGNLSKQLNAEKKENKYLQERLNYVKTDGFVEEEAKEKLGLLRPGEFFVIAPTAAPLNNRPVISLDIPNWKKWYELFF